MSHTDGSVYNNSSDVSVHEGVNISLFLSIVRVLIVFYPFLIQLSQLHAVYLDTQFKADNIGTCGKCSKTNMPPALNIANGYLMELPSMLQVL